MVRRTCQAHRIDGQPCRAVPLSDSAYCLMHDPANAQAVAEARRLGGLRRHKEIAIHGAYAFEGIASVPAIQRVVEVAIEETLALENSVARNRTLGSLAQTALKALEVGELAEEVRVLKQAVFGQQGEQQSPFDLDLSPTPFIGDEGSTP